MVKKQKIKPDLEKIKQASKRLEEKRNEKIEEIKLIGNIKDHLDYARSFWLCEPEPRTPHDSLTLNSAAIALDGFVEHILKLDDSGFQVQNLLAMDSTAGVTTGTVAFLETHSILNQKSELYEEEKRKYTQRQISEPKKYYIRDNLVKIDSKLVEMFNGVWSSLKINDDNSVSKAASSMKDVVTLVVKHFAPDDSIKNQAKGFTPSKDSRNGIIRSHRYQYIADYLIRDARQKELFQSNIDFCVEVQKKLNESHYSNDDDSLTKAIYSALDVLEMVFRYVG